MESFRLRRGDSNEHSFNDKTKETSISGSEHMRETLEVTLLPLRLDHFLKFGVYGLFEFFLNSKRSKFEFPDIQGGVQGN
jgi:hypothetical protein